MVFVRLISRHTLGTKQSEICEPQNNLKSAHKGMNTENQHTPNEYFRIDVAALSVVHDVSEKWLYLFLFEFLLNSYNVILEKNFNSYNTVTILC